MALNSKGCWSDAKVVVREEQAARKTETVVLPRIFAVQLACLLVCQIQQGARD